MELAFDAGLPEASAPERQADERLEAREAEPSLGDLRVGDASESESLASARDERRIAARRSELYDDIERKKILMRESTAVLTGEWNQCAQS